MMPTSPGLLHYSVSVHFQISRVLISAATILMVHCHLLVRGSLWSHTWTWVPILLKVAYRQRLEIWKSSDTLAFTTTISTVPFHTKSVNFKSYGTWTWGQTTWQLQIGPSLLRCLNWHTSAFSTMWSTQNSHISYLVALVSFSIVCLAYSIVEDISVGWKYVIYD